MPKTIAYLRVLTDSKDLNSQKLEIHEYADRHQFTVDEWMEIKISSRRGRKIKEVKIKLNLVGSERFKKEIEILTGRRLQSKKRGRRVGWRKDSVRKEKNNSYSAHFRAKIPGELLDY